MDNSIEQQEKLTEKEYRKIPIDSYSSVKDFITDRRKYYKKYVLNDRVEEEESFPVLMGNVTETLCFASEEFDEKFFLSAGEKPTASMNDFVEALYRRTIEFSTEDGQCYKEEAELLELAYNDVKYDKDGNKVAFKQDKASSLEAITTKFKNSFSGYFEEILSSRAKGMTVLSSKELEQGEKIKDTLFTHPHTAAIFRAKSNETRKILIQTPLFTTINGYRLKLLIDRMEINHEEKFIQPDDLKCTWNVDNFLKEYYLFRRSDLQAAIYYIGCLDFRDTYFPDYEVRHMRFLVADSTNQNAPLIYNSSQEDVDNAIKGFTHKNKFYIGLNQALEDLKWHKTEGIWNVSRENFLNNGVCSINNKLWTL
jgi:hypothetical protein